MKKTFTRALAAATTLTLGAAFAVGSTTAAYAAAPDTWTITNLTLDNPVLMDANDTVGDDAGFLGITKNLLLFTGGNASYSYNLGDMAPVAAIDAAYDDSYVARASDIKSDTSYEVFVTDDGAGGYEVASLTALDQDGNLTATDITLSSPINVSSGTWFVVSGFGYIALWCGDALTTNGGDFYVIAMDGTVTHDDTANGFDAFSPNPADHYEDMFFHGAGVGEFDGTNYWFVGTDSNGSISEFAITGAVDQAELLNNVDTNNDSDTFMVSTCSDRFYIHTENNLNWTSFFGQDISAMDEPVLSADATFSSASTACTSTPDPELPNTGIDAGAGVALAGLLAGLGAVAFIAIRRRQVASK